MSKKILFVDDENQILRALKRLFNQTGYETFFMSSAQDALSFLEHEQVDLLITDIRMPYMDGMEFLKRVKERYPKMLRVALSGYTDSKQIYHAIEANLAKLYLFKPWDNQEILTIVKNLFSLEEQLNDHALLETINAIDDLPTVPLLYEEVSRMVRKDTEIEKIAWRIENDPAIASRILRVANSAFYGAKTGSISQAIMFIGLINVKNIILSNGVFSGVHSASFAEKLWRHASLTNRLTHIIYEKINNRKIAMVNSSAGLLHNIGIVLMLSRFKGDFEALSSQIGTISEMSLLQLEQEKFGFTHAQIGSYLLNWWELPYSLVEVAMYHHNPDHENVVNKDVVSAVHLASHTAWYLMDPTQEGVLPSDDALLAYGLLKETLLDIIDMITKEA